MRVGNICLANLMAVPLCECASAPGCRRAQADRPYAGHENQHRDLFQLFCHCSADSNCLHVLLRIFTCQCHHCNTFASAKPTQLDSTMFSDCRTRVVCGAVSSPARASCTRLVYMQSACKVRTTTLVHLASSRHQLASTRGGAHPPSAAPWQNDCLPAWGWPRQSHRLGWAQLAAWTARGRRMDCGRTLAWSMRRSPSWTLRGS